MGHFICTYETEVAEFIGLLSQAEACHHLTMATQAS